MDARRQVQMNCEQIVRASKLIESERGERRGEERIGQESWANSEGGGVEVWPEPSGKGAR